jgi:hypothetical protein
VGVTLVPTPAARRAAKPGRSRTAMITAFLLLEVLVVTVAVWIHRERVEAPEREYLSRLAMDDAMGRGWTDEDGAYFDLSSCPEPSVWAQQKEFDHNSFVRFWWEWGTVQLICLVVGGVFLILFEGMRGDRGRSRSGAVPR